MPGPCDTAVSRGRPPHHAQRRHAASPSPSLAARDDAPPFDRAWFDTVFVVPCAPPDWPSRFAIVTAHDPGGVPTAAAANRARERELDRYLEDCGLSSFVVVGASPDLHHRETGRAFVADSPSGAAAIAQRFGQLGFFWVEDGIVYVAVDGSGRGWRVAPWAERLRTRP